MNAVAGGGSFLTVPALLVVGMPAINANATSTVALWPGSVASTGAYRRELQTQGAILKLFAGVSLVGGLIGALLLLRTSNEVFEQLLPYLLLAATGLFAFSPRLQQLARRSGGSMLTNPRDRVRVTLIQFAISVYGGFFGGGIGIMMLATLSLMGLDNINEMNALKTLLAVLINGIAVVTFVIAGAVNWPYALLMVGGAILGGYGGAAVARRIKGSYVRYFVVVIGIVVTIYLFLR